MQMKVKTLPFAEAMQLSLHENHQNALLILELVKKMAQRKISMRSIEGPIRIGQAAGEAARRKGWTPLMSLSAAISLNLGIFNLLNSRSLASVGINDKTPIGGSGVEDIGNRGSSLDQYYYQPSRSFQFTVKARF